MKRITFLVLVFLAFAFANSVNAQMVHKGKVGLSATVQESQFGIMVPVFLSERFVLAPALDFQTAQSQGTDLSIGLIPRFYLKTTELRPYLGARLGVLMFFPDGDKESTRDFVAGLAFGGEYFFNENFSIGVEAQGNFTFSDESSDRFGNPGNMNFNLGTMVSASIYF